MTGAFSSETRVTTDSAGAIVDRLFQAFQLETTAARRHLGRANDACLSLPEARWPTFSSLKIGRPIENSWSHCRAIAGIGCSLALARKIRNVARGAGGDPKSVGNT